MSGRPRENVPSLRTFLHIPNPCLGDLIRLSASANLQREKTQYFRSDSYKNTHSISWIDFLFLAFIEPMCIDEYMLFRFVCVYRFSSMHTRYVYTYLLCDCLFLRESKSEKRRRRIQLKQRIEKRKEPEWSESIFFSLLLIFNIRLLCRHKYSVNVCWSATGVLLFWWEYKQLNSAWKRSFSVAYECQ